MRSGAGLGARLPLAILLLAACGGEPETLTLRGEGSAATVEVSYQVSSEDKVTKTVDVPWRLDVGVGGDFGLDVVVRNLGKTGIVTCTIEGDALRRPIGTRGEASARCTARKDGKSVEWETKGERFAASAAGTRPAPGALLLADDRRLFFTTPHFDGYPAVLVRIPDLTRLDRE